MARNAKHRQNKTYKLFVIFNFICSLYVFHKLHIFIQGRIFRIFIGRHFVFFYASFLLYLVYFFFCSLLEFFAFLLVPFLLKPLAIFLIMISSISAYFMQAYGIIIDKGMLLNVLHTDTREAFSYFNASLVLWLIFVTILPCIYVALVKITMEVLKVRLDQE